MILVTGGCGYIGSHIVKKLSERGEQVVIFDNLYQGDAKVLLHGETLIVGDITDPDALQHVFASFPIDVVIHCAALVNAAESTEKKEEYEKVNNSGSRNVWSRGMMAGVKHFLYASSAAVYGIPNSTSPIAENTPTVPSNPYGETKLAGELSLQEIVQSPATFLAFRFFNVGGADRGGKLSQSSESRAIMQRLFAVASGRDKSLVISGNDYDTEDGTVVRDFVHVDDIAEAFMMGITYLRKGGKSGIINLGAGVPHTIGEVLGLVEEVTGRSIDFTYGPRIPGDISYSLANITKARDELGWEPHKSLREIVKDSWNAYAQKHV